MRLGVMQPYFFPYLGYFDLIASVDRWIVADTVQHMRHGWVTRNRVLQQASGWQYILVPVRKHTLQTPIMDIEISGTDWRTTVRRQLDHYRKRAPGYADTMALVERCLGRPETHLSRLNTAILEEVCGFLGLPFEFSYLSEMNLQLEPIAGPADWALRISQAVGASEYVNPPGGVALYDPAQFTAHGIRLEIRKMVDFKYDCGCYEFVPNLSIVDVLMWNDRASVRGYLDKRRQATGAKT
jgi:hypothetical protein